MLEFSACSDPLAKDLVLKLLQVKRQSRITAEEAVQHPYFSRFYQ